MTSHWRLEQDLSGAAWLHFDQQESAVNTLSNATLAEFDDALARLEVHPPKALAIVSDKAQGFIAGADVGAFLGLDRPADVAEQIRRAQRLFARLEALPCPTLALIHGHCLGGGLELALACDYRIASDADTTRLGFPEVRLGIFPGFGGSVRATHLLGVHRAMELMLRGGNINSRTAYRLGLVDMLVPQRQFTAAARDLLHQPPPVATPSWHHQLLDFQPFRTFYAALVRRATARRVNPTQYPAPFALIEHWRRHARDPAAMYRSEAERVSALITGSTAQNLIRAFLLRKRLHSYAKGVTHEVRRVHVVGSGVMGGDIAAWCALKALQVTLQDKNPEQLAPAIARAQKLFEQRLKQPRLVRAAMDRLIPDYRGDGIVRADVVIEAIYEDAAAKQALFKTVEPRLQPHALLATNTSSIPIETLSPGLQRPERLVGLHFFNPVARMQLVEVVQGVDTAPDQMQRAAAFTTCIDRLPLPVRSSPGFLINRVLMPYLMEAVVLMEEGTDPELIDQAALGFGMPMGPVALADQVGLDICLAVAQKLSGLLGTQVPYMLEQKVAADQLGRKSGAGFYNYRSRRSVKLHARPADAQLSRIADRLILPMLNQAVACLREGVVEDADLLDAGMLFGAGFAPFHGGPIHYARSIGYDVLSTRMEGLARAHGDRFAPDAGWVALT